MSERELWDRCIERAAREQIAPEDPEAMMAWGPQDPPERLLDSYMSDEMLQVAVDAVLFEVANWLDIQSLDICWPWTGGDRAIANELMRCADQLRKQTR